MTPQDMIDVIQAYKDGKQIESKIKTYNIWAPADNPSWNFAVQDYRIAPKQKKELYKYLLKISNNDPYCESYAFFETIDEVKESYRGSSVIIIKRLDHTKITIEE